MKRLRIEHATGFTYSGVVAASYNEARMLPVSTDSQFVLSAQLDLDPSTAVSHYVDYFGTRVAAFDVLAEHPALHITARTLVEVREQPVTHENASWETIADEARRSVAVVEMMGQSKRTEPHAEVVELAKKLAGEHPDPSRAALAIASAIGEAMEYMPGSTGVHSTAADAWEQRKGVCQDVAHIALGALRSVGIPARYVSGYLHPKAKAEIGVAVTGESHAWVEWFDGARWQGYDPTNICEIGDRHVLVGRGRDYGDVPPLTGLYDGPTKSKLDVEVTITREA